MKVFLKRFFFQCKIFCCLFLSALKIYDPFKADKLKRIWPLCLYVFPYFFGFFASIMTPAPAFKSNVHISYQKIQWSRGTQVIIFLIP